MKIPVGNPKFPAIFTVLLFTERAKFWNSEVSGTVYF